MKTGLLFFMVCGKILTAQLLTVNNLRHLTSGSLQNLDGKLAEHFNLERNRDLEDSDNRVYSSPDKGIGHLKVLTVFTNTRNCLAISLVTHDEEEIRWFHLDLMREGFVTVENRDRQGNSRRNYTKEQVSVMIKSTDSDIPAYQVIWRCP